MSQPNKPLALIDTRPPQSQEAVVERLLAVYDDLPGQLQISARYLIDHPHEVGLQSMRTLATNADVHPNSFVRLARHIGFDGYDAMRERFRDFVRGGVGSSPDRVRWLQDMAKKGGSAEILGSMASACLENTERMFEQQSIQDLDKAVDWMAASKRVFVLGLGLAYPLAYNFWYVARMGFDHFILTPRHGSQPSDDIIRIDEDDCLLAMTFQPYRRETLAAVRLAKARGAKTIGVTDSNASALCRESDLGLVSPTHTPQFFHSNSAVTALLESLCALLVVRGGERATAAIEAFNTARWEAQIYED
ncbi:MAG: MurR/RpiR family transcriptional regulator [Gammaproteobacteria bacterium]|nr:MurR/RpiR family transcriptional regulator [Gammaproteobacteria bacterium]MCZ6577747.1 MurR/RpiR family transcriptional regulator [Gammaproteobacteria bacterium]MCZ6667148.1 MurR/RpiR family transcriptional regulator [Gammaproteobacteria bacterium]MCZ6724258.1 MurR/RpiR family transcriptional regulator [Gammaproteobacteria bacterium]MCZ6883171.1 MurR/RpiR family transcriptional regulator [Gammaproteobacteria bacterium]